MTYLLIRQRFTDFDQWRQAFDAMDSDRAEVGLETVALTRNRADPDEIVVLFRFEDEGRVMEYVRGPGLAEAWRRGGVIAESNQATFLDGVT